MNASFTLVPSGAVRVTGGDRLDFIHGQVSSDVKGLPTPGGSRGLLLNARGQIEFGLRVYRRADDLYLHTADGEGPAVLARLQRYVVFDDVRLEDLSGRLRVVHLAGPDAGGVAARLGLAPERAVQTLTGPGGALLVAAVDRGAGPGHDLHVLADGLPALEAALAEAGAAPLAWPDLERRRVLAGLPDARADGFAGLLPQECGLEAAVSYRKGCYVGQEIMARLEARGHTNRHLVRALSDASLERGAPLTLGGREVGVLGAPAEGSDGWTALAVVRKDVPEGAMLEAGRAHLRLAPL